MKFSCDRARLISSSLTSLFAIAFAISAAAQITTPAIENQPASPQAVATYTSGLCAACVRRNLEYLAGPSLHGRGSGTLDEYHAAEFIARKLKHYGIAPAAENGQYIQTASVKSRIVTQAPVLSISAGDSASSQPITWRHGKEIAVLRLSTPDTSGPLLKLDLTDSSSQDAVRSGDVVLLRLKPETTMKELQGILEPLRGTAALVIVPESPSFKATVDLMSKAMPRVADKIGNAPPVADVIFARPDPAEHLWKLPAGTSVSLHANMTPWKTSHTWNVLGKIVGTDEKDQIVLLSAHLDHLGVQGGKTYPGADDDASGTVAVMELARTLAAEPKPRRTVVFALWGSEEKGMVGSRYFLQNPTFALKNIVANLEFEMIARPDPKVNHDQLWLTGWERTNLGPELVEHGAQLAGDPHPEEKFFSRSDNYALAKEGIVAQTVSSFGLHKDYHQPTDTLEKVDWQHLDSAIASMIAPVTWLANSTFTPHWVEGQKP